LSDESEDSELSKLQRAAAFMAEIRLAQAGRSAKLRGNNYLAPEQQRAITEALSNSPLVGSVKESAHIDLPVNYLAERFEEMCRRQGAAVDAELRPSVIKLLATELWVNSQALGVPAKRLLSATLHHGAIAPELIREFPERARFSLIHAMTATPENPRALLDRASQSIALLSSKPEFRGLMERNPAAIEEAVILRPNKAESRLRQLAMKVDRRKTSHKHFREPGTSEDPHR
jgi:hypothetical protein